MTKSRRVLIFVGGLAAALLLLWGLGGVLLVVIATTNRQGGDQLLFGILGSLLLLLVLPVGWVAFRAGGVGQPIRRAVVALLVFLPAALIVRVVAVAIGYPFRGDYAVARFVDVASLALVALLGGLAFLWQARRRTSKSEDV